MELKKLKKKLESDFGWENLINDENNKWFIDAILKDTIDAMKKTPPTKEQIKAYVDTLPYYGTCTHEYNEGFEDGAEWVKNKI